MNDHVIKLIKDKWLDCKKLSEREEALLFARIEKLEAELAARSSVEADGLHWCWKCHLWQKFDNDNLCVVCKTRR